MNKIASTVLTAALMGIGAMTMTSPVHAAPKTSMALVSSEAKTDVLFKNTVFVKSSDGVHSALDMQVKKYTEGTYLGTTSEGLAKVLVHNEVIYVNADGIARDEGEISSLKEQEEEELRLEEEEKRKAEEEQARKEAEEKAAAEKAAKEAEEAAAAEAAAQAEAEEKETVTFTVQESSAAATASTTWNGPVLTKSAGTIQGPSGKETYYNLPMNGVINIMRNMGNTDEYWVREDGVKMLGPYVIVAANLNLRPRGSLVETSLGMGIVCDTGGFAVNNQTQLDIATAW